MSTTYKLKKFGPITKRRDYSNTKHDLPVTDLIEVQKTSFKWFIEEGIHTTLNNVYPINSSNGKIKIEYLNKTLRIEYPGDEFEAIKLAKAKGTTYAVKVYAQLRKIDEETGETKEQEVLFGEIPMMTKGGSFIINGSEKVIVAQLLRAPGAYYKHGDQHNGELYNRLELIPRLGAWIGMYHKISSATTDFTKVSIDKKKAISLSIFLRAFGMPKDKITDLFGENPSILESIKRDKIPTESDAVELIHNILKRGDRITADSKRNLFANLLFNQKRYNLSKTGRYMLNRKLSLVDRLEDTVLAEDLNVSSTGKPLYKKGAKITKEVAEDIQESFKTGILSMESVPGISEEIYGNLVTVEDGKELTSEQKSLKKKTKIVIVKVYPSVQAKKDNHVINVIANDPNSNENHLILADVIASIGYYFNLEEGLGHEDDPDSLVNKRVVPIGELLQNQLAISLAKLERTAKERMSAKEADKITPKNVTNNKSVYDQFKTFFNTSQLAQFMDQMNPLAEESNKRRVTSLGPGGLNRETAKHEVRDVHQTHYGRICPIETPEGQNIGLILNFANYAKVNELGFIETPYYKVEKGIVIPKPIYLTASEEIGFTFAQSSVILNDKDKIVDKEIIARRDGEYFRINPVEIDYLDVSSKQMTSTAASAIPFLENDDANRALMGANMQRQAVPLLRPEAPLVGTGIEAQVAKYASTNVTSDEPGEVIYVDSEIIEVQHKNRKQVYKLRTFEKSNQGSLITQRAIVKVGDIVKTGSLLTDGPSFDNGELAIGKNVVVAFTTWRGYNFEDAVVLSERLVKKDTYTSIHIEEKTIEFRKQKLGDDDLTTEIPNVSKFSLRNLDDKGIVRVGSEVQAGDVLVGRVSPKGEDNPTPEEKLIAAIFSQKSKNIKDSSLKVSHGHGGTIIGRQILARHLLKVSRMIGIKGTYDVEKAFEEATSALKLKWEAYWKQFIWDKETKSKNSKAHSHILRNLYDFQMDLFNSIEIFDIDLQDDTILASLNSRYYSKDNQMAIHEKIADWLLRNKSIEAANEVKKAKEIEESLQELIETNILPKGLLLDVQNPIDKVLEIIDRRLDSENKKENGKKRISTASFPGKVSSIEKKFKVKTGFMFLRNTIKLQDDVAMIVKIQIAQKRKIKVGDKMAGRHGNKGVISNILPVEDMPHLADGTPVDIMLNPQGVPSRMNIGQVLELHLGLAAKDLNIKFATPVFDGINFQQINEVLEEAKKPSDGKFNLYDPISGKKFDAKVSVGVMYMLKLSHMVDDKMHARSVGPYSLITQQPLGGKSQNGGQRFGEMETWAIEAYGAANVLQELLTYKSDNIEGRNRLYNSLISGSPLPTPGTPESFNVLAYELRGLGMKLGVQTKEDDEQTTEEEER